MEKVKDRELRRNGSGCLDLTAYEAIKKVDGSKGEVADRPKRTGEIWSLRNGKLAVVIVPFEDHALVLTLVDEPTDKQNEIAINYNGVRWTATSMIQYAFNDYFSSYRKKVSDSEMNDIRDSIAKSLAPVLPVAKPHDETEEVKALRIERDCYKNLCELAMKGKEGVSCKE